MEALSLVGVPRLGLLDLFSGACCSFSDFSSEPLSSEGLLGVAAFLPRLALEGVTETDAAAAGLDDDTGADEAEDDAVKDEAEEAAEGIIISPGSVLISLLFSISTSSVSLSSLGGVAAIIICLFRPDRLP